MVKKRKPRILLFDIETTPNVVYTWGVYEENAIAVVKDWQLLCYAYKWLDEKKIHTSKQGESEKSLVKGLWELFDEADVVIAHNGDQFDIKKATALFLKYGMKPPTPFKSVDTKKVAKRYFRFDSNKLDSLGRFLGIGRKIQTGGFELWEGCMAGDSSAWRTMLEYNRQDVALLEKVYLKLRPYITNHPNYNLMLDTTHSCPNCGGSHLQKRGVSATRVSVSQRYQCQDCGAWSQGEKIAR